MGGIVIIEPQPPSPRVRVTMPWYISTFQPKIVE